MQAEVYNEKPSNLDKLKAKKKEKPKAQLNWIYVYNATFNRGFSI
ncbi:hypothetical protein ANS014_19270 [Paraclostridium bifermentans]|nr:hypothetical protein ANS014_19270 [Paraclostridium bifermentans]